MSIGHIISHDTKVMGIGIGKGIETRFLTLFILILESTVSSSERTMHTVSCPFFPLRRTVSPRNNCNSSIFAALRHTTELSSFRASSTINRLGAFFLSMIPVLISALESAIITMFAASFFLHFLFKQGLHAVQVFGEKLVGIFIF